MSALHLRLETPDQPEVLALIDALDAYQKPLYPLESFHGIDLQELLRPEVLFVVARDGAQPHARPLGCGALVLAGAEGELKRMYVDPAARGRGVGRAILACLEREAAARGCGHFLLETGYLQHEALALYERAGYVRRGPFGAYRPDPNSIFMEKRIR